MAYTTQDLLNDINARSFTPAGQETFTSSEILKFAQDEIDTTVVPALISIREEYGVRYTNISVTAGTREYEIPERSIGLTVRELHYVDSNGYERDLVRLEPEDARTSNQGEPTGFYILDDSIYLQPTPSSAGTLKVYYYIQHGEMVEPADAAVISEIDTETNIVTVTSIPSTWATGNILDFCKPTGSQAYRVDGLEITSTLIASNEITLPSLPARLAVGDYITITGKTALVQIPRELRPVVAQLASARILENMSQPGASNARKDGMDMLKKVIEMYSPRTPGANRKILTGIKTWGIGR